MPENADFAAIKLVEKKFKGIIDHYFTGENLKIFKHVSSNKSMQVIVNCIYGIIT